jgi:hypothetical protein
MSRTDAEHLEILMTHRDNTMDLLIELDALSLKPDYNIDGQAIFWSSYRKNLEERLAKLDEKIEALQGPYEVVSFGI